MVVINIMEKIFNKKKFLKKNNLLCGFTLLELLVVIAIIGVLASIVMASLNSSRNKADTSFVKQQANQIQKTLALYYDQNGRYGTSPGAGNHISGYRSQNTAYGVNFPGGAGDCLYPFSRQGVSDTPGTLGYQIALMVNRGMLKTNPVPSAGNMVFWCGVSPDGQSYAIAFEGIKTGLPTYCVDSSGNIKESNLTFTNTQVNPNDPITSVLNNPVTCR
jgi:prepilin-type N-terminal cleavage/methylation domain-containing protein